MRSSFAFGLKTNRPSGRLADIQLSQQLNVNFKTNQTMASRRKFLQKGSNGILTSMILPFTLSSGDTNFSGLVVDEEGGETIRIRDGKAIVKIKIAKTQGSNVLSFLSEMFAPGDAIPVHKHLNEDELIFLHKGKGEFTLGE